MLGKFLRAILPVQGHYALVLINKSTGKPVTRHYWHSSIEELEQASKSEFAVDAYFACAAYSINRRKQENVRAIKALWCDLDLKGTTYTSLQEALSHAAQFCKAYSLPAPTVVYSGGGFHLYWPLGVELDAVAWSVYANGLHNAASTFGLQLDVKRTRDCASILRLPGGKNYKYADAPTVKVLGDVTGPYELERFVKIKELAGGKTKPKADAAKTPTNAILGQNADADADFIADNCGQIAHLRTTGSESEPHWYACANILKHCSNGLERFLEWSGSYDGYNEEEARAKFSHAQSSGSGPTLCRTFETLRPDACKNCRQLRCVTTPLNVRNATPSDAGKAGANGGSDGADASTSIDSSLPEIPQPFKLYDGELWGTVENSASKTKNGLDVRVASCDVRLVRKLAVVGSDYSLLFKVKDKLETTYREITIPSAKAWGTSAKAEFAAKNVFIANMDAWQRYVLACMSILDREHVPVTAYDSFGWQEDGAFICGPWRYSASGRTPAVLSSDIKEKAANIGTSPDGNIKDALHMLNRLMAQMSSNQILLYCLAMGSPLMRFIDIEEGGVVGWNYSHESGTGKSTTVLAVETSIGKPGCTRISEKDTAAARGVIFGMMNSLPVTMDDPAIGDGTVINNVIELATSGTDKNSLRQDRTMRSNPKKWRTVFVGASNFNPFDYVESQKKRRIVGFAEPVKPHLDQSGWSEIYSGMRKNAGWVMHELLKLYVQPQAQAYAKERIDVYTRALNTEYAFRSEDRFNVAALAVALTALEFLQRVARTCIGSPLPIDAKKMVLTGVAASRDSMEIADHNDGGPALEVLGDFINENVGSTITVHKRSRGVAPEVSVPNGLKQLTIINDMEAKRWIIHCKAFKDWAVKNGRSPTELLRRLTTSGHLYRKGTVYNMSLGGHNTPEVGAQRCHIILHANE